MKELSLTHGRVALVDDEDYERLSAFVWQHAAKSDPRFTGYAVRYVTENKKTRRVWMHREVLGAPAGLEVDHINGNGLDNRRENLRLATRQQNARNRRPWGASRYLGVTWLATEGCWKAQIKTAGRLAYLGRHRSEAVAAAAYDKAAMEHFGEFARLNFPCSHEALDARRNR